MNTTYSTGKYSETTRANEYDTITKSKKTINNNRCKRCEKKYKNAFIFYPNNIKQKTEKKNIESYFDNLSKPKFKNEKQIFISKSKYSPYHLSKSEVYDDGCDIKHCLNLYKKGQDLVHKRLDQIKNHNEKVKSEVDPECTFQPYLYNTSKDKNQKNSKKAIKEFVARNYTLAINTKKQNGERLKRMYQTEEYEFKPKINEKIIAPKDLSSLQKEIPYINDYIFRRRNVIQRDNTRKIEEENKYRHNLSVSKRKYQKNFLDKSYDDYLMKHMSKSKKKVRDGTGERVLRERYRLNLSDYFDENTYSGNSYAGFPDFSYKRYETKKCEIKKYDYDLNNKKTISNRSTNDEDFIQAIRNINKFSI